MFLNVPYPHSPGVHEENPGKPQSAWSAKEFGPLPSYIRPLVQSPARC